MQGTSCISRCVHTSMARVCRYPNTALILVAPLSYHIINTQRMFVDNFIASTYITMFTKIRMTVDTTCRPLTIMMQMSQSASPFLRLLIIHLQPQTVTARARALLLLLLLLDPDPFCRVFAITSVSARNRPARYWLLANGTSCIRSF